MATKKIDFKDVLYDRHTVRWVQGNNAVGLNCIARIELRSPTKKEEEEEKKDWLKAKEIFDTFINVGQKFKPSGEKARSEVVAKITYINNEKQSVTWKQCNMTPEQKERGLKPAAGRWSINAMLSIHKSGNITFI